MGDRAAQFAPYAVMVILPLSVLAARRLPLMKVLKMSPAWVAIFAVGLLIGSQRDRLSGLNTLFADQQVGLTETRIHTIGTITTTDLGIVTSPSFGDTDVIGINFLSKLGPWLVEKTPSYLPQSVPRFYIIYLIDIASVIGSELISDISHD